MNARARQVTAAFLVAFALSFLTAAGVALLTGNSLDGIEL